MKKVVKLISLFILLLIINCGVVRAANKCGNVTISTDDVPNDKGIGSFGGGPTYKYTFDIKSSTSVIASNVEAYCHNPGIHDFDLNGINGDHMTPVTLGCTSLLFDETGNTPTDNIFGAGLMYILNASGYSYNEKFIAENMYEMLFTIKNSKSYNTDQVKNLKYYINSIYSDIKNDLQKLATYVGKYNVINGTLSGASKCTSNCETPEEAAKAIELLKDGLKAAILYANGDIKNPSTKINAPTHVRTTRTYNGTEWNVNTLTFTINMDNFPAYDEKNNNNPSVNLSFTFNNRVSGITAGIYLNDEKVSNLENINILKYTTNGKGKVTLKVEILSELGNCNDISYTLKSSYNYNSSSYSIDDKNLTPEDRNLIAEVLKALGNTGYEVGECSSRERCQGFYVLQNNSNGNGNNNNNNSSGGGNNSGVDVSGKNDISKTASVTNTINLCKSNGDPSSDNDICPARISNVSCVECEPNKHTVEIKEGYTYSDNNTCNTTGESLNVNKCIIDNKDTAGNDYKSTELSYISNKGGANVYCKEDYTLTLPGSKVTEPGTYFTLDPTSISGTKYCYSSRYNSTSSVQEKVKAESERLINAFNEYLGYSTLLNCIKTNFADTSICHYKHSDYNKSEDCKSDSTYSVYHEGIPTSETNCKTLKDKSGNVIPGGHPTGTMPYCTVVNGKYYGPGNEPYTSYNSVTKCRYLWTGQVSADYTTYNTSCTEGMGSTYTKTFQTLTDEYYADYEISFKMNELYSSWKSDFADYLKDKIGDVSNITCTKVGNITKGGAWMCKGAAGTELIGKIESTNTSIKSEITGWNNSFDWKMDYNFQPIAHFWYQEEYMKNVKSDIMDRTYKESDSSLNLWYCDGNVNEKYECIDSETNKVKDWSKTIGQEDVKACTCDVDNGCKQFEDKLYNAKYVKQEETKTATYQVQEQFYSIHPSGSITVGPPGQSDKINNATGLANVLPVSLNTIGTRRYLIWFENLGEYYSENINGELGRIWGYKNSVLPALLKTNEKCTPNPALVNEDNTQNVIHSNGVYACKYTTDCPDTTCDPNIPNDPNCPYSCEIREKDGKNYYWGDPNKNGEKNRETAYLGDDEAAKNTYHEECDNNIGGPSCDPNVPDDPDCPYSCEIREKDGKNYYWGDPNKNGEKNRETAYLGDNETAAKIYHEECDNTNPYTCANPKIDNNGTPIDDSDDKYTYCDNLPQGSKNATYQCRENFSKSQYKTDCCPGGKCPPSTKYSCAVPYEETINGEVKYSYNNKLRVSAEEFAQDCGCRETTAENGKTVYYGKNGKQTDEKTYKTQCCPNGECPVTCSFCLYDGNKLNIQYRPITSEDLNPNNRELGNNWKVDEPIDTTMELKAYVTTKEIEEDGDKIFDTSNDKKNNNFVMKVTMDPSMISEIRKMNNSDGFNKGFVANTLKCYDYKKDDVVYENIYCYSTFIDELIKTFGTGNNKPINFTTNRPLTDGERKNSDNNEKYFTSLATTNLLSESNKSKWNITTTTGLEGNYNKYGLVLDENGNITDYHVGPSWK